MPFFKPFVAVICLFFAACSTLNSSPKQISLNDASLPCWFQNPVADNRTGQIGIARDIYTGGKRPVIKSRERALQKLADFIGFGNELPELNSDSRSISIGSRTVHFTDDIVMNGYIYSYAELDHASPITNQCAIEQCNLNQCTPAWLCTASTSDEIAQLGVSYLTSDPGKQYDKAESSALKLAQYQFGSQVQTSKRLTRLSGNSIHFNQLRQNSEVEQHSFQSIPHLMTHSCKKNNTIFTRVAFPSLSHTGERFSSTGKQWLTNPKYNGIDGAVGSVEKKVSSGLFSDQVNLAIKRAIVALALEQNSNLKEDQLIIEYDGGSSLYVSTITEDTNISLKADILSFHILENEDDSVAVHVWVAKANQ